MRTTLTLDDDVAARLRAEMRRRGSSLKETVNEALRVGLSASSRAAPMADLFRVAARPLGLRPGLQMDRVEALLDEIDGAVRR